MKKQVRPEAPQALTEHCERWNRQWCELRERNPAATFDWYQVDKRSARDWILPALREMNQGHCSFCDGYPLEPTTKEPIEHFRPKSRPDFYHLAYTWSNLYYSCDYCQSSKREQWDELLIAPDVSDYSFDDYFKWDYTTGSLEPNPMSSEEMQERARRTIRIYGLDSESRRRYRLLEARKWSRSSQDGLEDYAYRNFIA